MRPRTLRIEGLRSYIRAQTIDFRDRDLMAVVGDTGAGKSSILEALCFALYGTASWSNKAVKELISHGQNVMRVELTFAADGHEWTLTRTASRESYPRPITTLVCPELDLKLERKKEVDARVQELVGLDYSAFLRAVVLPQGRFQELLQATAADRARILKGIFRLDLLDSMREWAEKWRSEREPQWATLLAARAKLHDDPAAEAERAAVEIERLVAEAERLADARERHEAIRARADDVGARLRELEDARRVVLGAPMVEVLRSLEQLERAEADIRAEEERLEAEQQRLVDERDAVIAESPEGEHADSSVESLGAAIGALERGLRHVDEADKAEARAAAGRALERERALALDEHRRALAQAEAAAAEARAALDAARRADMAAHLAGTLAPGDACPVCRQDVPDGFRAPRAAAKTLAQADKRVKQADKAEKQAREAEKHSARAHGEAEGALARDRAAAEQALDEARELFRALPEAIAPADIDRPSIERALAQARARRDELRARGQRLAALEAALRERREAVHALHRRRTAEVSLPARGAAHELARRADFLAPLARLVGEPAAPPLPEPDASGARVDQMRAYAEDLQARAERALEAAGQRHRAMAADQEDLAREAADALREVSCSSLSELDKRMGAVRADQATAEARHREASAQIERAAALDRCIAQARDLRVAVDELRKLLADGKFVSYAVERKQRALLRVASQLFSDMTGGRFGFAADFQIVDNHAREARSTDTLSGGETFLASLALALALVELANRTGGRLDALFLDEGFGALDADALEQAVQALTAQAARGRLVVVISHLQAVAENIEHVLLVEATPVGSRAHEIGPGERGRFDLESAGLVA